jgi:cytochrome c oxidase assembly factor CtaG
MSSYAPNRFRSSPGGVRAGALALLGAVAAGALVVSGHARPADWARWPQQPEPLAPLRGWRFATAWQLDAPAVLLVAVLAVGYLRATRRVARAHPHRRWPQRHTAAFFGGLAVAVVAPCSSVGVYDMTLFSVHMTQHLMLIMVAPPLLAAGRPITLLLHSVRNPWHRRWIRVLRSPAAAVLLSPPVALVGYTVTIVATHLSGLMDRVMNNVWLGQGEHLLYLGAGYLFFVLVFGEEPTRWRLSIPGRLMLVVVAMAVDTFVGLVLLQTVHPIAMMAHPGWGGAALSDTRTGGAIMWFFGDALMVVLIVVLFRGWVRRPEYARRQSGSWLERARLTTFEGHTASRPPGGHDLLPAPGQRRPGRAAFDDDEARRLAYNDWLACLNSSPAARRTPSAAQNTPSTSKEL